MFAFDGHDGNRQDRSDVCRPVRLSRGADTGRRGGVASARRAHSQMSSRLTLAIKF